MKALCYPYLARSGRFKPRIELQNAINPWNKSSRAFQLVGEVNIKLDSKKPFAVLYVNIQVLPPLLTIFAKTATNR